MISLHKTPPNLATRVLVVIVNYRTADLTILCLRSLQQEILESPWIHAVVVENDSGDAEAIAAAIRTNNWSQWASLIVAPRNGGFAYGNNRGIEPMLASPNSPEYFLLLNPDTEIRPNAVRNLVYFLDCHPEIGIAGSSFEDERGIEWPFAFRFHTLWSQFEQSIQVGLVTRVLKKYVVAQKMGSEPVPVDWVAGASMMIRSDVIKDIGLMDERYFLYFEEVDYCLQARRAGWQCWYVPHSRVMHISGQSTGVSARQSKLKKMPDYWFASRTRYFVKNHGLAYARLTDIAYGLGLTIHALRCMLPGRRDNNFPGMLRDFLKTSALFRSNKDIKRQMESQPIV